MTLVDKPGVPMDIDHLVTDHEGDHVWLKAFIDEKGKRIGITECCTAEDSCARHCAIAAARAAAWMAFAKGLALLGNHDAGEHKAAFDSWWLSYGIGDARRVVDAANGEPR